MNCVTRTKMTLLQSLLALRTANMKEWTLYAVITLGVFVPYHANADLILVSGSFAGETPTGESAVTNISGTWEAIYDDALLAETGFDELQFALTSLTLSPNPLGTTTFDTANSLALAGFRDAALVNIIIGGVTTNTGPGGLDPVEDDFWALYGGRDLSRIFIAWTLATEPTNVTDATEVTSSLTSRKLSDDELLELLSEAVPAEGQGISLSRKLELAQTYLDVPDSQASCALLNAFVNQVQAQTGKKLTPELADQLIADAQRIMGSTGCN